MLWHIRVIPLVKLHTRRFHVAPKTFLRKLVRRTVSNDMKQMYLNNSESSSSHQMSSPDYLGIESDEGVIVVNAEKYSLPSSQPTGKSKEKFHVSTFGVVRYDSDNELKFHGQYGRRFNFTFPHSASENFEVHKNFKSCDLSKNQPLSDGETFSASDEAESNSKSRTFKEDQIMELADECYVDNSKIETFDNSIKELASQELNFVDKDYFKTLDTSNDLSVGEQNSYKDFISDKEELHSFENTDQDMNYVDECYFGNHKTENLDHIKKVASDESKFIDKQYFETSNSENVFNVKQNSPKISSYEKAENAFTDSQYISSKDNMANNLASNELNFLDKNSFEDLSVSQNNKSIKQEFSKNIFFDENTSNNNYSHSNNDEILNKDFVSNDKNNITSNDVLNSSTSFTDNNDLLKNTLHNHPYVENVTTTENDDSYNVNSFGQEIKEQFSQDQYDNFKSLPNMLRSDLHLKENMQAFFTDKKSDINSHKNIKPFAKENSFKYSQVLPEEPNQDDQMPTAHDFVKKLRKEQEISKQTIKTDIGNRTLGEKVDSKGFRILKNQVKDLSHFTRDEILNILKQNIVYSDDELLVLNKPYSLVIHESQTTRNPCLSTFLDDLARELDHQATSPKLFTVHRLDKETTGCLLLARNETMAQTLKSLFAQKKIIKKYWVITSGVPDPAEGIIDIPISEGSISNRKRMVLHPNLPKDITYRNHSKRGKPAVTSYKVLSQSGNAALVEATPVTGIKHQIRVHFGFGLGCPILGDHKYSHLDKLVPQKLPNDLLQRLHVRQSKVRHIPMHIHAKSVEIPGYFEGRNLFVHVPLPEHMKVNLKRLKFRKKDMA